VSNLFNASSTSFFPNNLLKNVSKRTSSQEREFSWDELTSSSLFDLFCRDGENREYFNHDFYDNVRHRRSRSHFRIGLEALEKILHTPKDINEYILARIDVLCSLADTGVTIAWTRSEIEQDAHQEKNTYTRKDHFRGREYLSNNDQSPYYRDCNLKFTRPTPSPRVAENA